MNSRSFKHNFHDAYLEAFELGPRREVTLKIALDPILNNRKFTVFRLGGVENFETVAGYFRRLPIPESSDRFIAPITELKFLEGGKNWVVLELSEYGRVSIQAGKLTDAAA